MSEDQVTHTPTPWSYREIYPYDDGLGYIEAGCNCIAHAGDGSAAPSVNRANAKFIVLAVNNHDALTARVAELESANAALMTERASYIATHREHEGTLAKDLRECRHTLGRVRADLVSSKSRVAELEAENERLRELIECAALYLDAFEGDIMEIDPEVLTGIPLSPTNMAAGVRAAALKPEA